jgi:hypothetical protein
MILFTALLVPFAGTNAAEAADLEFVGQGSFQVINGGSQVRIEFDSLWNRSSGGTSGTIYLKLIANTSNSPTGSYVYTLGTTRLGELRGGSGYTSIVHTTAYTAPPDGRYYVFLVAVEYPNLNTVLASVPATENPHTFGGGTGGGGGGGGGPLVDLVCPCSYDTDSTRDGSPITLEAARLANRSTGTTTGTLHLKLFATTGSTPTSFGYDLADINLADVPGGGNGTLAPGHFFSSIRATGRFQRPPDGEYNVFMYVSQFPQTNTILDSIAFPEKLRIGRTGNGGGYCGLGPEMALVVPLCFALRRSIRRRRARAG